jgi:hypothetical protein
MFTWDESSTDEDVHVFTLLGKQLHLSCNELWGHLLGVTSNTIPGLLNVHLQRLRPERLKLFQSCWSEGGYRTSSILYLVSKTNYNSSGTATHRVSKPLTIAPIDLAAPAAAKPATPPPMTRTWKG